MTINQIEYRKLLETRRANKAQEAIKREYNRESLDQGWRKLDQSERQTAVQEGQLDVSRHQAESQRMQAQGSLDQAAAAVSQAQTAQKRQLEDKRHNLTNEYYAGVQARQNTQDVANRQRQTDIAESNAVTNRMNVGLGYANVGLGYSNLAELTRHDLEEEKIIPSRIATHYGGVAQNVSNVGRDIVTGIGLGSAIAGRSGAGLGRAISSGTSAVRAAVRRHPYVALATATIAGGAYIYNNRKEKTENILSGQVKPEEVD